MAVHLRPNIHIVGVINGRAGLIVATRDDAVGLTSFVAVDHEDENFIVPAGKAAKLIHFNSYDEAIEYVEDVNSGAIQP